VVASAVAVPASVTVPLSVADARVRARPGGGRGRTVIGALVVAVVLLAGGAAAWSAESSGNSGYRMAKVVRASVAQSLAVVGTVEPVSDASAAFQVSGQVATITATVGEQVSAGQSLGTLDTASLSETVSSDQSTVDADEAKLSEDEASETAAASTPSATTTTTTIPSTHGGTGAPGGTGTTPGTSTITQDQQALTSAEAKTAADQQQEAVDLAQAESNCGGSSTSTTSTTTSTTSTTSTTIPSDCAAEFQKVALDQQQVSGDQGAVSQDELTLSKALAAEASTSTSTSTSSSSPTSLPTTTTPTTTPRAASSGAGTGTGSGDTSSGATSDSPEQIASDQSAIDSANAQLIEAQQSLDEAQLSSPINGTIASVGINVGDTVSADSSTEVIVIIGTQSFQVAGTLTSTQVSSVKVGQTADVEVDGVTASIPGTVSQVGPVQSGTSGYTYPVVVALPSSATGLFSGSTANVVVSTGQVANVLAVPTSAVQTVETTSYVEMLSGGTLTRKVIKVGMVGGVYTQVLSGLKIGQSVVLADYALAVPSSNTDTDTFGAFGGGGGGFGGGGFGGGAVFKVSRIGAAPGGAAAG
jgi:multidrug efflux pump subunit AcrA (membrane-fusion protein)